MKIFSKVILFLTAVCAFGLAAHAQDTGGLKGKVRAANGDSIGSANITVRQNGEDIRSASTDAKGNFNLDNLKVGTYSLVFSKSGYSSGVLSNVEVSKGKTRDLGGRLVLSVDQGTQVIVKGSVFHADGRSLGGAKIEIEEIRGDGSRKRVGSGVSSYSGEFTFRFAEGAAKYRVTASMKDLTASKEIEVSSAAIYRLAITLK